MSDPLRETIYANMSQKETEELLQIWVANDRDAWIETVFEVIKEILEERQVDIPAQGEPGAEDGAETMPEADEDLAALWEKIAEKEPPEFYNAKEVLRLSTWLGRFAKVALVAMAITSIPYLFTYQQIVYSYFLSNPFGVAIAWVIAGVLWIVLVGVTSFLYYFGLKSLGFVLRMLMETEYRSRG